MIVFGNKLVAVEPLFPRPLDPLSPLPIYSRSFQIWCNFPTRNSGKNSPPPASYPEVNNILQLSLNKIQPILDQ